MQRYYVLTCNQLLQFMSDPVSGHWLWPTNQCLKPAPTDRGQQSKRLSLGTPGLARQVWMAQEVTLKQHQDCSHQYCLYRLQWQIAQLLQQNTKNPEGFWTHHLQGRSSGVQMLTRSGANVPVWQTTSTCRRRLCSASSMTLDVRRTRLSTVGDRAFPVEQSSIALHRCPISLHLLLSS